MRQFVVVGHDAPTTPDFSLDDLPGAGRLDVLCRCVTSALCLSHDLRRDVRVHLVLGDAFTVTVDGSEVRNLRPDERSTAALVRGALEARQEAVGHVAAEASPGVSVRRFGLAGTLEAVAADATVVTLHEDGDPAVDRDPPEDPAFVLSDHRGFADDEADLLASASDARLSLGPERLHADQAVTVAHGYLDTAGYDRAAY
jgi:tRNA (pseudouridine54-N1)-methyltransferase